MHIVLGLREFNIWNSEEKAKFLFEARPPENKHCAAESPFQKNQDRDVHVHVVEETEERQREYVKVIDFVIFRAVP